MIYKLMKKKYAPLIFSLLCGVSYFGLALVLISQYSNNNSMLLGFFFFPAIICGGALIVLKAINLYIDKENLKKLNFLVVSHMVLLIISLIMIIELFIN